jgi:VWFA-related protein
MVRQSPSVIYPIGLGLNEPPGLAFSRWAADSEANLRRFAAETGGRLMLANEAADLSGVYAAIADELNNQYLLGYAARDPERIGWRRITVESTRPGIEIRTRAGYYYR